MEGVVCDVTVLKRKKKGSRKRKKERKTFLKRFYFAFFVTSSSAPADAADRCCRGHGRHHFAGGLERAACGSSISSSRRAGGRFSRGFRFCCSCCCCSPLILFFFLLPELRCFICCLGRRGRDGELGRGRGCCRRSGRRSFPLRSGLERRRRGDRKRRRRPRLKQRCRSSSSSSSWHRNRDRNRRWRDQRGHLRGSSGRSSSGGDIGPPAAARWQEIVRELDVEPHGQRRHRGHHAPGRAHRLQDRQDVVPEGHQQRSVLRHAQLRHVGLEAAEDGVVRLEQCRDRRGRGLGRGGALCGRDGRGGGGGGILLHGDGR